MVMSSSNSAAATTGTAGREICSGGGGISTSGGSSIASNSFTPKLTSEAVSSGKNLNSPKWNTVATTTLPQSHGPAVFLKRSFAVWR